MSYLVVTQNYDESWFGVLFWSPGCDSKLLSLVGDSKLLSLVGDSNLLSHDSDSNLKS